MSAADDVPTITCACGRVLRLPGATPGRTGRCPDCGAAFRVPDAPTVVPDRGAPEPEDDPFGGYALAPAPEPGPSAPPLIGGDDPPRRTRPTSDADEESPRRRKRLRYTAEAEEEAGRRRRRAEQRAPIESIARGGILPLPKRPEDTLLGSLRYPLWDDLGLMALTLLPLVLGVTSVIVFGVIPWALNEGGAMLLIVPITIGFVVVFAFALAYTLALGGSILVNSALGEIHHPRWPELELGTLLGALLRWGLAFGVGLAPTFLLVRWLLPFTPELDLGGRVLRGVLTSFGGLYALVALLAVWMHEDATAVSPQRVLPALFAIGPRMLGVWLLLAATVAFAIVAHDLIYRVNDRFGIPAMLFAAWLTWVVAIYAGMVILRATGRAYDRRSKRVGWFEKRRRRVEDVPDPTAKAPEAPPEI